MALSTLRLRVGSKTRRLPGTCYEARRRHRFIRNSVACAFIAGCLAWPGKALIASSTNTCEPPTLGAPCASGGIATPGNPEPAPALVLGNPVHLATGNKYQLEVDLPPNPSAPGIELIRHYNALSIQAGALGHNWTLSYDTVLERRAGGWQIRAADGSLLRISAPLAEGRGHAWAWPDGRRLHFDAQGKLVRISAGGRVLARIDRHAGPGPLAGRINRVKGARGHVMQFHYSEIGHEVLLSAVDTPVGRFHFRYEHPAGASGRLAVRLAGVERPDSMRRIYHYESTRQAGNTYALTGLSVGLPGRAHQRLASWEYDRYGRVTGLKQHGRALPDMRVEYIRGPRASTPGLTRVHSSNGRYHDVHFQRIGLSYRRVDQVTLDTEGRPVAIAEMRFERAADGQLAAVIPPQTGWPGLVLRRSPTQPAGYSWATDATGETRVTADWSGRPSRMQHANGDAVQIHYDAQGRPERIVETGGIPIVSHTTHLQWRARRLLRIAHDHEHETRHYNPAGNLIRRTIDRPAPSGRGALRYEESFEYDAAGRLTQHQLPEGGALHYSWRNAGPRATLAALRWEDREGQRHTVIESSPKLPGYRYGNGLHLLTFTRDGPHTDGLALLRGDALLWRQSRRHDTQGRVVHDTHAYAHDELAEHLAYVYDERSRLQGAAHRLGEDTVRFWYAWHDSGALSGSLHHGRNFVPTLRRDASGLPLSVGDLRLEYGANRRLARVTAKNSGRILAEYRHNAFGHRIIKRRDGHTTHFLYLEDRLVAEAEARPDGGPPAISRRYLYAGGVPVGLIVYSSQGQAQLFAVHADLTGAPRMITDENTQVRWRARYGPTGQARRVAGDLDYPLRFKGQYEDTETGWRDNMLRTYAPDLGQYLEPDPLGPLPGTDAFGYAAQQPWRYSDPYGLLLFAFDGTRYSADSAGNVWRLAQAYRDGAAHYHSGPGNSDFLDWDAVVAWRAGQILENQWQALLTALEHQPAGEPVQIDLIGFSRGAALARHFGNRIAAHLRNGVFSVTDPMRGLVSACVDLRFMGLFDTVAQFGVGGSHNHLYDFSVAQLWSWVAHAVALHEHRWTMPLLSADAGGAGNVVEAPFVGAHADIGGGVVGGSTESIEEAGLAHAALAWMHWQARAATIDFAALDAPASMLQPAPLRDMRDPLWRSVQRGDRAVQTPSGDVQLTYQDDHGRLGRQARDQVEAFINRVDAWRTQPGDQVGTVDMHGYSRWLEETLGWSP